MIKLGLKPEQELELERLKEKIPVMTEREKSQYIIELIQKYYVTKNYYVSVISQMASGDL